MKETDRDTELQRQYYAATASRYDELHFNPKGEHIFALDFLIAAFDYLGVKSVLEVGSGTGTALSHIKSRRPGIVILGIEPVKELRDLAYAKGIQKNELIAGDANCLGFAESSFDLVCAFGVLHHVRRPDRVIDEMLRVAKKAVFISDSNSFGQGGLVKRTIKQIINAIGLWKVADLIKTGGKGYIVSDGDGVSYSYSVFTNYRQIRDKCASVHFLNTNDAGLNLYRSASHVALLGVKK